MVEISILQGEHKLKVGEKASLAYEVHPSVGVAGEVSVANAEILKIVEKKHKYNNEENAKMPGGDAGSETFIFEALKKGETTITYLNNFRGKTESTHIIKIIVE